MVSTATMFVSAFLVLLGSTAIVLSMLAGRYSVKVRGPRATGLASVGVASLVAAVYILLTGAGGDAWDQVCWPLLVMMLALLSGLMMVAAVVYVLVGSR